MKLMALGFLVVGAVARFLPHPPNMTPLTAMALFAGTQFPWPYAMGLGIGAMLVGDIALGWTPQNLAGYLVMAITVAIGRWVRRHPKPARVAGGAVSGSLLFFILSNFGVWLEGWLYPRTWEGLTACYVAGIPFYRNQLLGDLAYTALLFGGFALMHRWVECGRRSFCRV